MSAGGEIAASGYTDAERLETGELVYTGLVRGFIMATAPRAPFDGGWTSLVNENFANMADVHRILGTLDEGALEHWLAELKPRALTKYTPTNPKAILKTKPHAQAR